jgi:hypothetical protein
LWWGIIASLKKMELLTSTSTLLTDLPLRLAIGGFSLATVAEVKTIKRAAIPIMVSKYLFTVNIYSFNIPSLYTRSVLLFGASLFWQYTSERSELFTIIGIAALFIVFPSATVAPFF